jgi:ABC-type uncharacterized transport system involved in gliding motility auxiliary subunit
MSSGPVQKGKKVDKVKTGANSVGFVAAVLVALVALNLITTRVYKRVDFTHDKIYTLSPGSKELVAKLPDRMTVKAFISSDLQPPFSQTAQYVRDMLNEYAEASGGKLKWEAIDPGSDSKLEEEAQKFKVPKMRRGRISSNKVEIGSSYLGVAFQYGGNIESIPEINAPEGLEYQVTTIIKKLAFGKRKIAFATGEGELSPFGEGGPHGGMQAVRALLEDYELVNVNLGQGEKPIADDVDALIVAGPKQPLSERAKFVLDQFLMKGKAVALFVDGMVVESPQKMPIPGMDQGPKIGRKNDTGLDDLLEHYGFKVRDDILMNQELIFPGLVTVQGQLFGAHHPVFAGTNKIGKHASTSGVQLVIFPFGSTMEQVKDKQPGATVTELLTSLPSSWRQSGFFLFDPMAKVKPGEDKGPFPLAFAAEGKLTSFFAGKPYPNEKGEKVTPPDPNSSTAPGTFAPLTESQGSSRLVIVADSDFIADETMRLARMAPYGENIRFFLSIVDYLSADTTIAPLRAKALQSRPLAVEKEWVPTAVKYGNIVGVPLLFVLFGIVRWRVRRARRLAAKL